MAPNKQTAATTQADKGGDLKSDYPDESESANLVQRPHPRLSTLFRPSNYFISRDVMTHFDDQDIRYLRAAAKNTDHDLYQNLQHMIEPQWVYERTTDPDTMCHGAHVEPCEGFKLAFGRGIKHRPDHCVCKICDTRSHEKCPVSKLIDHDHATSSVSEVLGTPYRRLEKNASPPAYSCACVKVHSRLHLCGSCRRVDMILYQKKAFDFGISVIRTESRSGSLVAAMYSDQGQASSSVATSTRYPGEYRPPEDELGVSMSHGGEDRRKRDIWSFGCILLTLLSFSLGGVPLVKRLHTIRRSEGQLDFFFSTRDAGTSTSCGVKHGMKSWASSQIANHRGPWVSKWLQLIFDNILLVVPAQRHEAKQGQDDLDVIRSQAHTDNVWHSLPPYSAARPLSSSWTTSLSHPHSPSGVSLASSALNSGFQ
jgi:serine/threonine protein kinase